MIFAKLHGVVVIFESTYPILSKSVIKVLKVLRKVGILSNEGRGLSSSQYAEVKFRFDNRMFRGRFRDNKKELRVLMVLFGVCGT